MPIPLAIPLIAGGLGLTSKIGNYFGADSDEEAARAALAEENKTPYQKYGINPQFMGYYSRVLNRVNNPIGLTGAEKAGAQTGINNTVNTLLYNAKRTAGGNLSKYLSAGLNPGVVSATNDIYVNDARMKRADEGASLGRLGQAVSQFQQIDNLNTQTQNQQKMMREQALGQSILQNKAYKSNFFDSIGSDLIGGALMLGMGGVGKTNTTGMNPYMRGRNPYYSGDINPYVQNIG